MKGSWGFDNKSKRVGSGDMVSTKVVLTVYRNDAIKVALIAAGGAAAVVGAVVVRKSSDTTV